MHSAHVEADRKLFVIVRQKFLTVALHDWNVLVLTLSYVKAAAVTILNHIFALSLFCIAWLNYVTWNVVECYTWRVVRALLPLCVSLLSCVGNKGARRGQVTQQEWCQLLLTWCSSHPTSCWILCAECSWQERNEIWNLHDCSLPGSSYCTCKIRKEDKAWDWDTISACWLDFTMLLHPCFTKIIEHLWPWNTEVSLLTIFLYTYVWEILT